MWLVVIASLVCWLGLWLSRCRLSVVRWLWVVILSMLFLVGLMVWVCMVLVWWDNLVMNSVS